VIGTCDRAPDLVLGGVGRQEPGHGSRFRHLKQAFLAERHAYDLAWEPLSSVALLGVTNLTARLAAPQRPAELIRGEWAIEKTRISMSEM
jgi:hypothetical protein